MGLTLKSGMFSKPAEFTRQLEGALRTETLIRMSLQHAQVAAYCFNGCAEGMMLMKTTGRQFRLDGTYPDVIYAGAVENLSTQKYPEDGLSWPWWIIKKEEHYTRLMQMCSSSSSESLVTGIGVRLGRGGTAFQSSCWQTCARPRQ